MAFSDPPSSSKPGPDRNLEAYQILQHEHRRFDVQRQPSSNSSTSEAMTGKQESDGFHSNRPKANSSPSRNTHTSTSTHTENKASQRDVRTLPPWIDSFETGDEALNAKPTDTLLSTPSRAHSAQHNTTPAPLTRRISQDGFVDTYDDASHGMSEKRAETGFFSGLREPVRGRKWDHAREGDPVIMQSGVLPTSSPWLSYIRSSMYGPALAEDNRRVTEEFLQQQTPGYQNPWRGDMGDNNAPETLSGLLYSKKQRRSLIKRLQHNLLMHPLVPLLLRLIVLSTSTIALGLSASVHHLSDKYSYPQNASTTMAIVVDVVAIPYILYITWDEYTGKPLGLRSPKAKIRLVLLDLFFIIFESANLSLAFEALTDENGSCRLGDNGYNFIICSRVEALCGILMMALVAWMLTFSVSILRLVERVGGREEGD